MYYMLKKFLDIWTVQNNKNDLISALKNINTDDAIIFENAQVGLTIDNEIISNVVYDTAIFSEKSDIVILILKDSGITSDDAKNCLEEKGIKYNLVSFVKEEQPTEIKNAPEVWYARDSYVVAEALDNSISKNVSKYYTYDRNMESVLDFKFLSSYDEDFKPTFDTRILFTGKITLEDKIILITRAVYRANKKLEAVEKVLNKKGFIENLTKNL